jgi:hypothetical protein
MTKFTGFPTKTPTPPPPQRRREKRVRRKEKSDTGLVIYLRPGLGIQILMFNFQAKN